MHIHICMYIPILTCVEKQDTKAVFFGGGMRSFFGKSHHKCLFVYTGLFSHIHVYFCIYKSLFLGKRKAGKT